MTEDKDDEDTIRLQDLPDHFFEEMLVCMNHFAREMTDLINQKQGDINFKAHCFCFAAGAVAGTLSRQKNFSVEKMDCLIRGFRDHAYSNYESES